SRGKEELLSQIKQAVLPPLGGMSGVRGNERQQLPGPVSPVPSPPEGVPRGTGENTPADVVMKLAIVGRRNTGKSTFINSLAQAERMIVSEVPGTTRDSVDVRFERDGQTFIAIDTAGVRRKRSIQSSVDFYSL